jgi:uroporphyrin-III C-methyltransferase
MGASRIGEIARELIKGGLDPSTPVAILTRAFMEGSKVTITTIGNIATNKVSAENPSVIVIGDVVAQGLRAMRLANIKYEKL